MVKSQRICDRCGKPIKYNMYPIVKTTAIKTCTIFGQGGYEYSSYEYDLCPRCGKDFQTFMEAPHEE